MDDDDDFSTLFVFIARDIICLGSEVNIEEAREDYGKLEKIWKYKIMV